MHAGMLLNANDFEVVVPANFVDLGVPKTKKATGAITAGACLPLSPVLYLLCYILPIFYHWNMLLFQTLPWKLTTSASFSLI